jgi:hypothetical protein
MVNDGLKSGKLNEMLTENMQEVFNVMTRMFQNPGYPRVHFKNMYMSPQGFSTAASSLLKKYAYRSDFDIAIQGYPGGKMTLIVL